MTHSFPTRRSSDLGFYAQNNWYSLYYYNYPRPMSSAVRNYGDRAFIQELRLTSKPGDMIDYVVGAYLQNQFTSSSQDSYLLGRSEEHTSELQSLMRISYAVFCLKKKTKKQR